MKRLRLLSTLSVIAMLGAAAAPPATKDIGEGAPRVLEVQMLDKGGGQWRFEPTRIVAHHGDIVRFIQADIVPHNVQFKKTPAGTDLGKATMGPFLLEKGATYEITIDGRFAPGVHEFVCTPHEMMGMVGSLEVQPGN